MVDLPGSGNECLPADDYDLLVLEVEALQEERRTWRGRGAPKEFDLFYFKRF